MVDKEVDAVRSVVREVTHEVFDDVTLGGFVLFLFLLQLLQQMTVSDDCTC